MTRLAPTFPAGNLVTADHSVRNCWMIPGDTPEKIRVYTDPFNLSAHQDVGYATQCWGWTGLRSGTLMTFSVSCIYPDGEEQSGSFQATTTGSPSGGGTPATPPPLLENLSVHVKRYLGGVTLEWDSSEKLLSVLADIHPLPNGGRVQAGQLVTNNIAGHHSMAIPGSLLRYSTTYEVRLTCTSDASFKSEYTAKFSTDGDPRFNKHPEFQDKHVSISDVTSKRKSLEVTLDDDRLSPVTEFDSEQGSHTRLTEP